MVTLCPWFARRVKRRATSSEARRHCDQSSSLPPLNGLRTLAPSPATSRSLRVTSVKSCVNAVAASRLSMTGTDLIALMRPIDRTGVVDAEHASIEGGLAVV
jgi:hypothetical protein